MKSSIPLVLYLVSLGLFALAAWSVSAMVPLWKDSERQRQSRSGQLEAEDALRRGRGQELTSLWDYRHAEWWEALRKVNLVGKLPPPPTPVDDPEATKTPAVEQRPLAEIVELVSLVHDGEADGRGGSTYVIVRYQPGADVEPPEWYLRENSSGPAAMGAPGPGDRLPLASASGPRRGNRGIQAPSPHLAATAKRPPGAAQLPTSTAARPILQKVWVVDNGDPRHGNRLWPPFGDIRLVGVSADAQVAWFVRDVPPPKEGDPAPAGVAGTKEEALRKAHLYISPELLAELRSLQGREAPDSGSDGTAGRGPAHVTAWIDVPETRVVDGVTHISRKDEERFADLDELLLQFHVDTYVGSSVRGLIVRGIDAKLSQTLGIAAGEVLIELNGRPVRSRAEAWEIGKRDYENGVRTFTSKWLANGAIVERTWRTRDR